MSKHEHIVSLLGLPIHRIEFLSLGSDEVLSPGSMTQELDGRNCLGQASSGAASESEARKGSAKSDPRKDPGSKQDETDVERDNLEPEADEDEYDEEILIIEVEREQAHVDESEDPADGQATAPSSRPDAKGNGMR